MASPISLRVKGVEYVDFVSANVTYGIESFARAFYFEFSDKWLQSRTRRLPWSEGDEAQVLVHGEVVVDGFIDDLPIDYTADSHNIGISGRSWTGNLVDCSAVVRGGSWRKISLGDIAKQLCEPHGVSVRIDPWAQDQSVTPPRFEKWAIEDEETVFQCIQRAAEMRGLFLVSDAGRNIVITKASPVVHPGGFVFGENVVRGRRIGRFADRFSDYLIKSQSSAIAGNILTGKKKVKTKRSFRCNDSEVPFYRPLVIMSHAGGSVVELERRAMWERNVRAGRGVRVTYEFPNLKSATGKPWPINELIAVDDAFLDIEDNMLIAAVSLSYADPGGEVAMIELCRPEAFDVMIPPRKLQKRKRKTSAIDRLRAAAEAQGGGDE